MFRPRTLVARAARALVAFAWLGILVCPVQAQGTAATPFAETLRQAEAKSSAKEWKEAAVLWERVVRDNPTESRFWGALATARYSAGDYKGAIPAYEKAAELGNAPATQVYNIACCYALLGDKERAMQTLERAMAMGFPSTSAPPRDADLKILYDDPRFRKLFGTEDVSRMSRARSARS
jgi:tetratricopeptide (TPR) repeat protein